MERKIIVPVTLQKDARLSDLDVDVELEVSCSLSHQILAPAPPPKPAAAVKPAPEPAALPPGPAPSPAKPVRRPAEEKTMSISVPAFLREAGKPAAESKPRQTASKTKIDNVLDELLMKKKAPKK